MTEQERKLWKNDRRFIDQQFDLAKEKLHREQITAYEKEITELLHMRDRLTEDLHFETASKSYYKLGFNSVVKNRNALIVKVFVIGMSAGVVIASVIFSLL